jgi:hypothetical protein
MRTIRVRQAIVLVLLLCAFLAVSAAFRAEGRPRAGAVPPRADASSVAVDVDDIGGVVTSSHGAEAGVWVIAEQVNSPTKFAKIVVTDDQGRYLVPDLPKGNYKLWVRGYGLVDSMPVAGSPGTTIALTGVVAPNPRAAAQYYPAAYWASLMKIPTKSEFPMTIPPPPPLLGAPDPIKDTHANERVGDPSAPTIIKTRAEWMTQFKACWTCHQMGMQSTRQIPANLGTFPSSEKAWERLISSGQVGRGMMQSVNRMGHDRVLSLFADWGDRIAAGELPPVPPRPQGIERNVVITMWNWATPTAFLHAMISTDRRNPTVNANGPVYGADWSGDCHKGKKVTCLAVLDPKTNESYEVPIPLPNEADREKLVTWSPQNQLAPSPYFGDELPWDDPVNPGPTTMDEKGRVWFNVETRVGNPDFCKAGSSNPYAKASPRESGGKGVDVYDPKTGKFGFVDLCFESTRIMFSTDKDNTLYFSVQRDGGIGWLNTRLWDETHDAEKSQGWCAAAPGIEKPGAYGVAYNTVDDSFWYSDLQINPGRLIRMVRGSNPPATCQTEVYEVPYDAEKGIGGNQTRGIDIDSKGVVWTPLQTEGVLASFDRTKCKTIPTGKDAISGKACREGWTSFTHVPGPTFQTDPNITSDNTYYMFIDKYNSLGLGKDVVIIDGANSDSLIAYQQDTKQWIRLRVPYRMGFFSRFFDARVDDPNAGWKGKGAYSANMTRGSWLTEGGKGTPSQLYHFQIRPDPLAK